LNFLDRLFSLIKISLVGAELFHADGMDGQTDMTKLIVAFRNLPRLLKKETGLKESSFYETKNYSVAAMHRSG
jgi:hypothetical protein